MSHTTSSSASDSTGPASATDAAAFLRTVWQALGGEPDPLARVHVAGAACLPSVFGVTEFAAATMAAAGLAASVWVEAAGAPPPSVRVDRRLASLWFSKSLHPEGWTLAPQWSATAGDYRAADGWIRLHTNAPHHEAAALAALGVAADREAIARAVAPWRATELETAIVEHGGCAAAMRSLEEWREHPQGRAVAGEPLVHLATTDGARPDWRVDATRPLRGLRVLDLTRILAGPVATRFLAGLGADVLRIDPPGWEEPGNTQEVVLGKRCARLDLKQARDRAVLEGLLAQADVLVHGYRPDALERLGLGAARRQQLRPGLVDVSLDAYGWSGPWQGRRGFDSLLQMSTGIADAGMRATGADRPHPLPVQALDHGTGYLMAAAALLGLARRLRTGQGSIARLSLARTAQVLIEGRGAAAFMGSAIDSGPTDLAAAIEATAWGPARRLRPAVEIDRAPLVWDKPSVLLGSSPAAW